MGNTVMELNKLDPAEKQRTYYYPDGAKVILTDVTHFLARDSGHHRLQAGGKLYIVAPGWTHIEIDAASFTL